MATSPLRAPLSASFTKATKEIELSESDDSGQCVMSVYRGLTVTGHVRDVEGRPVRRGVVTAYAAGQSVCSARVTGKSGDFHLGPLLLDPIQIRAESWTEKLSITHEFACSRQRTVHAGDRDVTLVVRPGCKITGVIESAKSGDSQTVYVEMVRPGASRFGSWHSEHVHDDGTFSLFVHEPGNYDLVAYDAKRKLLCEVRDLQVDEGDIRAGKTRSLGPVPVQATGLVRLVLRWADMRMVRRELVLHVKHAGREYHGRPLCQMTTEVAVPSGKSRVTLVQNSAYSNEAPRTTILDTEVEVEVGRSMEVQAELRR